MNNTVKTTGPNGQPVEVYLSEIDRCFDEYLQGLDDPAMIRKTVTFAGCMKYIFEQVFKARTTQENNKRSIIDYSDVATIEQIWDRYTALCYKSGIRPTIQRFSILTGISHDTFDSWRRGEYRNKSKQHSDLTKRMLAECESSVADAVIENSIGGIFMAKALYGWRETSPAPMPDSLPQAEASPAEIMERYKTAALPEVPDDI